jgi:hypothetical protein
MHYIIQLVSVEVTISEVRVLNCNENWGIRKLA